MRGIFTCAPIDSHPDPQQRRERSHPPGNMSEGHADGSSKVLLTYKHLNSCGIKAGLGILKAATSQWKQEKKTRTGAGVTQLPPASCPPCRRSPLDQLAALVLHGQSRTCQQGSVHSTKPQNCKRLVVLGAPRVGKTSILRRYLRDGFVEDYNPTSEDFLRKLFSIRGESYQIDILDASRERDFPAKRRLSILTGASNLSLTVQSLSFSLSLY